MRRQSLAALAFGAFAGAAAAQGPTILVLDASSSMWGQIDGTAKITLVQGVVDQVLDRLPDARALGLAAYGHRTAGACSDAEVLVSPDGGARGAIRDAVAALRPTGETPMTDAVRLAAEEMSYADRAATVILVSDGMDTCAPDPCALARDLQETGADFTAHVVAFDVDAAEALDQMRCIAEATGGMFRAAADAGELATALTELTAAPDIAVRSVTLRAIDAGTGEEIVDALTWDVMRDGRSVATPEPAASVTLPLGPGDYTAHAARAGSDVGASVDFTVEDAARTVTVRVPASTPAASLDGPDSAPIGAVIDVSWEGPGEDTDFVSVAVPGEARYETYSYTRGGSPLQVRMPPEPGDYELRYVRSADNAVLATRPISATPVEAELELDTELEMGASVPVVWLGPDYEGDYISVAKAGEDGYVNSTYTSDGSPLRLLMPPEPGAYEVRYVMSLDATVLETRAIEVLPVGARLFAEARAKAGAQLEVDWDGPDYVGDIIAIAKVGAEHHETYARTREGGPLSVPVPLEPGAYELRYVMRQDATVLAAQPLEVVDVSAALDAVDTARAGAPVVVTWDGPAYPKDYLSVAQVDDPGYAGFRYVRDGNPLILDMPAAPGDYEIRYIASGVGETVLARRPITLEAVTASLDAPESVRAGGNIAVSWQGPDYRRDYVSVAPMGADDRASETYVYTSEDSPALLPAPDRPGVYELRYQIGADDSVLARRPITVTE